MTTLIEVAVILAGSAVLGVVGFALICLGVRWVGWLDRNSIGSHFDLYTDR